MDESLKRRLVGATVLVSLIVIFVPMLLEDQSERPPVIDGTNIPPRPERESGFPSSQVLPLQDEPFTAPGLAPNVPGAEVVERKPGPVVPDRLPVWKDRPERAPEPEPVPEPEPLPQPEPPVASEPVAKPARPILAEPKETEPQSPVEAPARKPPAPAETAPKPLARPAVAKPAPRVTAPRPAATRSDGGSPKTPISAWAVQVGSFSDRANADKLVRDLLAARYPAFQEETKVKGSTLYRVRVGPEADRELADAMAAGITKRFKLNGRVVRYP